MEQFRHVKDFVFDNPVLDQRGNPLYTYDVVLVSMNICKRLQQAHQMSIGLTKRYDDRCYQIHHYNAQVLELLNKWNVEEIK